MPHASHPHAHLPARLHRSRGRAFALLMTLAVVALLTVVILAFFSRATLNRQISFSSANQGRADQMARSSGDYIIGQLRREMHEGSDVATDPTSGAIYMRPLVAENSLPLPSGVAGTNAIGATTIIKISADPATTGTGLGRQTIGSAVSISTPSANGRSISEARWYGTGGPRLGSATLPTWVYTTRSGVETPSVAEGANPYSPEAVVGRFAYTVYDVSGRLDANIAGYRNTPGDLRAPLKTWQAYADLTTLGLGTTEITRLATWRDGAAAIATPDTFYTNLSRGDERGFLTAESTQNRFVSRRDLIEGLAGSGRTPVFGTESLPSTLASSFTHSSVSTTDPSWGPTLISSTSPNFQAGAGVTSTDYRGDANADASVNRFIPFVRFAGPHSAVRRYADDGTFEPYDVVTGDRAVTARFSLAKLAWLGWDGPAASAFAPSVTPAQREEAIRQCFGLQWNASTGKWSYLQFDSTSSVLAIKTLAQVAAEGREPNFFEMLNAGILNGSLGQHPGEGPPPAMYSTPVASIPGTYFKLAVNFEKFSGNRARHLLQIGANIVDQYDRDSYPTLIDAAPTGVGARTERQELEDLISGVENLPYISRLHKLNYQDPLTSIPNDPNEQNFKFWWLVELWNPHQQWVDTGGPRPARFRVRAHGNCFSRIQRQSTPATRGDTPNINYDINPLLPGQPTYRDIYFADDPGAESSWFFIRPRVIRRNDLLTGVSGMETAPINIKPATDVTYQRFFSTWDVPPTATNYVEFNYTGIFAGEAPYYRNYTQTQWRSGFLEVSITPNPLITMAVECWDGTRWRPYSQLARTFVGWGGTHGLGVTDWDAGHTDLFDGSLDFQSRPAGHAPDPRTDRFSLSKRRAEQGSYWPVERTIWMSGANESMTEETFGGDYPHNTTTTFRYLPGPMPLAVGGYTSVLTGGLMVNRKDVVATPDRNAMYYSDPDGVVRPGDGIRMEPGSASSTGDGNYLYHFDQTAHRTGRVRRRPVVLNRPFESVAELGYVYRDLPGKNLDFWTQHSADAGLLDLFCLREEPSVTAGRINLNRAGVAELKAILSGALKARIPPTTSTGPVDAPLQLITAAEADKIATAIRTQLASGTVPVFGNNAEMALSLAEPINNALDGASATEKPFKKNKAWAEAPIRALSQLNQNRTWNLLIDVVAQPGRLRRNATSLQHFMVEGERRYWIHVAIDRATGKVVHLQMEPVL
ncbi:hypothetical protein DB346_01380 [Verrucomicrobia bacterium LW23]|nr:hypothetical protein DB346_01380 [Verrucomicrobia bacterium LW23]